MYRRKYRILILAVTFLYVISFCSCNASDKKNIKIFNVSNISDLIFDKDKLVPNKDFTWNTSIDEFLSKTHGAETMTPDNEKFEELRYHHIDESDITTLIPPVAYSFAKIPIEADVAYAFNKEGLYKVGYSWIFNGNQSTEAKKSLEILKNDLNSNENIIAKDFELPDLSKLGDTTLPYQYKWSLSNETDKYIEMSINKLQQHFVLQLTIEKE